MRTRIAIAGTVIGTAAGITIGRTVRWWRTWGVDPIEAAKALPGDHLVPTPTAIETRGITIDAPPEAVWPWLVQMGFDRAGWYSYDQLDMRGKSADRIVPAWQVIAPGDVLQISPDGGFQVRVVEPGRALVLYSDTAQVARMAAEAAEARTGPATRPTGLAATSAILGSTPQEFAVSWTFALEPFGSGQTRLIERFRIRFGSAGPGFRVAAPFLALGVFGMMRRQMLGIRERAHRTVVAPPLTPTAGSAPLAANGHAAEAGRTELLATAT